MTDFELLNLLLTNSSETGNIFNWRYVFEHAVNLVILLGVLVYFLKDSVRNFLVEGIEDEINSIKESITNQGQAEREEIIKQANLASNSIKKEAQETIQFESERAKQEIQSEVVTLALQIAEKVIKENLTETEKQRFIDEFTKNVGDDDTWHQSQH